MNTKFRNVPLYLGAIMTFDIDSCENNTVEAGEVEQSIDLPWSILEDYDANNEARLLRYGNAADETLINSTRYGLENEGKYIKIGYSTHLDLQPVIRIRDGATGCADSRCNARFWKNNVWLDTYKWENFTELEPHMMNQYFYDSSEIQHVLDQSSKDELSIRNMYKTDDIADDVTISYHWEYSEGLSLPIESMIAAAVSDPMRNGDNFIKSITFQCDYRTCTFYRYDVEAIFHLKPIINYHLEIMRSSGFRNSTTS
ncbi:hypothetical protein FQA39_LY16120 [Lamprigera yunnana]|nr:hypothetical protein FQA39_LY16120 [Lamprigera yunnana]